MVYNPGLECLSRLARDVEEAINPGVSRAKIRGSISGSKKSMNHRRGRAPSQNQRRSSDNLNLNLTGARAPRFLGVPTQKQVGDGGGGGGGGAAHFLVHCREFGSPNCRSVGALADAHATTAGKQWRDGGEGIERSLHRVRAGSAAGGPAELRYEFLLYIPFFFL